MTSFAVDQREIEILLALAWAAPLHTSELHTLAVPEISVPTLSRLLNRMLAREWVERTRITEPRTGYRTPPKRKGDIWQLAPKGWQVLPDDDRRPVQAAPVRHGLLEHDLSRATLIATLIHRARPQLSGAYLEFETRIDQAQPRPRCDALLIFRRGRPVPGGLPWVRVKAEPDEVVRGWAIEVDRDTEPLSIIREKAVAYKRAAHDPAFYTRYGHMPIPLWLVPDRKRAQWVLETWREVWPEGRWYLMTDATIPTLMAVEYNQGERPLK